MVVLVSFGFLVAYSIGYVNGANSALLFKNLSNAQTHIRSLKHLENKRIDGVKGIHIVELEANMGFIEDITDTECRICKIPERFSGYRELFGFITEERIASVKKESGKFLLEAEGS